MAVETPNILNGAMWHAKEERVFGGHQESRCKEPNVDLLTDPTELLRRTWPSGQARRRCPTSAWLTAQRAQGHGSLNGYGANCRLRRSRRRQGVRKRQVSMDAPFERITAGMP